MVFEQVRVPRGFELHGKFQDGDSIVEILAWAKIVVALLWLIDPRVAAPGGNSCRCFRPAGWEVSPD